jgi:hypothetical protein
MNNMKNKQLPKFKMKNLLHYKIEKLFRKKPIIKIFSLLFISIISLFIGSFFYYYFVDVNFTSSLWSSWSFLVDAGSHVEETQFAGKFISVIITILGMLFFATLISLLTSGIDEKLEELKKGRSNVVENNHTIILGWSNKIFSLINQISKANENENKNVIVVLSGKDKIEMDLEVDINTQLSGNTEVITRTGELFKFEELKKVSVDKAKNLIILEEENEFTDNIKIRTLLAIKKYFSINIPIIVELRDEITLGLIKKVMQINIFPINMVKTVNRLIAQSIVNPGIGRVYSELLDFNGPSFYLADMPQFVGEEFSNLLFQNDEICICGISNEEETILCPKKDYKIKVRDKLIILCDGKQYSSNKFNGNGKDYKKLQLKDNSFKLEQNKQILIIGNHIYLNALINEIFEYFDVSTKITIISSSILNIDENQNIKLINNTYQKHIKQSENDLNKYDHIIVFSNNEQDDKFTNDSEVLVNYILIKDHLSEKSNVKHIVAEIFDDDTEKLLTEESSLDFIISEDLISKYISSIAFDSKTYTAWEDLFSYGGNLIQVKEFADLFQIDESLSFKDIANNIFENNAILIGYIDENNIIHLNPINKSIDRQWSISEKLIYIIKRGKIGN